MSLLITYSLTTLFPVVFSHPLIISVLILTSFLLMGAMFNQWLWRILWYLKLIPYPDLSGTWTGRLTSSRNNHSNIFPVVVTIRQTLLHTSIDLRGEDAYSYSLTSTIYLNSDELYTFQYIYEVFPPRASDPDQKPYRGMGTLILRDSNTLSGYYEYFDRDRQQSMDGQMYYERKILR